MSALGRYLVPLSGVPLSRRNVAKVGRTLAAAYRSKDTAPLPPALGIDVSGDPTPLSFVDFVRIFERVCPPALSFSGRGEPLRNEQLPRMIAHATAAGSRVDLVTDATLLDPGRAYALVQAGLAKLTVSIDADPEKGLRSVERLVAMRDANRKTGPRVEVRLGLSRRNVDQLGERIELCHARLPHVEPIVLGRFTDDGAEIPLGDPAALAALRDARALAERKGLRRTIGSIDAAIDHLTRDLASAPCYVPWYSACVSTDGEVHPCHLHAIRGTSVGNALREPFEQVWNGPRMRAFRAGLRERRCADAVCSACRHEDDRMNRVFGAVARLWGLKGTSARLGGARPSGSG